MVGLLRAILTLDTAEFETASKRVGESAKAMSKDWKALGSQATQLGTTLTKTLTLPIVAGLGASAKAAIDFESSFAGVRKTVEATEPEFKQLAQTFRDMAKIMPVNVNELNRIGEAAGALGIRKADIGQFVEVMAKLGVTTNLTSDQAANAVARIQNIFGAAGQDTDRLASTLVALGNAGASTETEIVEMGQRIAGAGHTIGLTQAQVLAFASTLASVGINAEAGGSAISRIFLKMNDAVMDGGQKLAEFARVAGVSSAAFKQSFETDAAGATVLFINGLSRLKAEGENTNKTMEGMIGKNIILKDTLNRLAGSGELLTTQLELGNKAWKDNTALTKEAEERFKTTASQLAILWGKVRDVGITIGDSLLPAIQSAVNVASALLPIVESLAKGFSALPGGVQLAVLGFLGVVAAAGPALFIFGQLVTAAGQVAGAFAAKGIATRALAAAFSPLQTALRTVAPLFTSFASVMEVVSGITVGLMSTLGAAAAPLAAIAVAGTAMVAWLLAFTDVGTIAKAIMGDLWDLLKAQAEVVGKVVVLAWRAFADVLVGTWDALKGVGGTITDYVWLMGQLTGAFQHAIPGMTLFQGILIAIDAYLLSLTASTRGFIAALDLALALSGKLPSMPDVRHPLQQTPLGPKPVDPLMNLIPSLFVGNWDPMPIVRGIGKIEDADEELAKAERDLARAIEARNRWLNAFNLAANVREMQRMRDAEIEATAAVKAHADAQAWFNSVIGTIDVRALPGKDISHWLVPDHEVLQGEVDRALEAGFANVEEMTREAGQKPAQAFHDAWAQGLSATTDAFAQFAQIAGASMSDSMRSVGQFMALLNVAGQGGQMMQRGWDQARAPGSSTGDRIAGGMSIASGAMASWSSLMQATSSTSRKKNAAGGALAGAKAGAAFGPWGIVIGAGVGAIVGALRDGHNKSRDEIEKWVGTLEGGFDGLHKQLLAMGREDLWVKLTQGGAQQNLDAMVEVKALTELITKYGLSIEDLRSPHDRAKDAIKLLTAEFDLLKRSGFGDAAIATGAADGLNGLIRAALDAGTKLPASLQPYLQALGNAGLVADDVARRLLGLPELVKVPWQEMQTIAEEFGIDLAALGPNFQSAKLGETAEEFAAKFMLLIDNGADVSAVIGGMGDEAQTFLDNAKKWGIELPASMRPVLEALLEAGELTDENGDKLTDLKDVKFAQSIADQMQPLFDKLDLLIDRLTIGLPNAFAGLGGIRPPTIHIPVVYDVEDPSSPSVEDRTNTPVFARGSGGLRHFNPAGSPAMLHGWEEVLTAGQGRGVASMVRDIQQQGASGRAGGGVAEIHLGGRLAARIVVPYMQGEVRRYEVGR